MAGRAKNNENNFSLAETLNTYYICVIADIPPFDPYSLPPFLPAVDVITRATYGSTSLGLGLVRRSFCIPKISPTCFADDFDVYMACHLISFLFD